jgi:hypothetical protein
MADKIVRVSEETWRKLRTRTRNVDVDREKRVHTRIGSELIANEQQQVKYGFLLFEIAVRSDERPEIDGFGDSARVESVVPVGGFERNIDVERFVRVHQIHEKSGMGEVAKGVDNPVAHAAPAIGR